MKQITKNTFFVIFSFDYKKIKKIFQSKSVNNPRKPPVYAICGEVCSLFFVVNDHCRRSVGFNGFSVFVKLCGISYVKRNSADRQRDDCL